MTVVPRTSSRLALLGAVFIATCLSSVFTSEIARSAELNPGDTATITTVDDGRIASIGPLKQLHRSEMTPRKAMRILGRASVTRGSRGTTCTLRWRRLGLRLTFVTYGLPRRGRCPKSLQSAAVAAGSGVTWSTQNGLLAGAPLSELERLHPDWYPDDYFSTNYILIEHDFGYGSGPFATLWAIVDETAATVTGFGTYVGQAGD